MKPEVVVRLPTLHADQVRAYRVYQKSPRFVLRCGRRWGKTAWLSTLACDCAVKGGKVGWFVPEARYSREPFLAVKSILAPIISTSSKVEGEIRLTINQGQVAFWSLKDNELAARGRDYDLVLFDEHAFNKPSVRETWEKAVRPTLYDRNGRAVFASNTRGIDEENHFYQLSKLVEAGEDGWHEYWAPTASNPLLPAREPDESQESHDRRRAEAIEQLRRENAPNVFLQEFEAGWVSWDGAAFFELAKLLDTDGQPVAEPAGCGGVYATVDTATKTGNDRDGTAVCYWAITPPNEGPHPLVLLDWDIVQIEGALLETWLPIVFQNLEDFARRTRARAGSQGAWIEDKSSGMVLLQHARNRRWPARPIDSKLTAMGKSERAISVSGYVYRGLVKISRHAYEKTVVYKGASRNHLLDQVLGFRVGEDQRDKEDDGTDAFCYGISVGLGNAGGF